MSKLVWDSIGEHLYETGIDRGVLYLYNSETKKYDSAHRWNGLISISENPTGAEPNELYADNIKYLNLMSVEEFEGSIEAYTYPEAFAACDGSAAIVPGVVVGQQARKMFGMSYRTKVGNDVAGSDYGYKIHIVYGATASPSERSYETINDSPEAITFSWDFTTVPVEVGEGYNPSATVTIDASKLTSEPAKTALANLEKALWGGEDTEAHLPLPAEIKEMFSAVVA